MNLKKLLFGGISLIVIFVLSYRLIIFQLTPASCAVFELVQSTEVLETLDSGYEASIGRIAEIYQVNASQIHRNGMALNPPFFYSYSWRDKGVQHSVDFEENQPVMVHTGWDENKNMKMSNIFECFGEPDYFSTAVWYHDPGILTSSLLYLERGVLVIIYYDEKADIKRGDTEVEVSYFRVVQPNGIETFIKYAYVIDDNEVIARRKSDLQPWYEE